MMAGRSPSSFSGLFFISNSIRLNTRPVTFSRYFTGNAKASSGKPRTGMSFTSNLFESNRLLNFLKISSSVSKQRGPLQASLLPFRSIRNAERSRSYATHRDFGNRYSRGQRRSNPFTEFFHLFKVPLAFTGAFIVVSHFAVPLLLSIPGISYLKRRPDLVVYGLIGINILGFLAWKSPAFSRSMYRYGLLHKDSQFNVAQMVGSAFSHQEIWHLGLNMFALWQFGGPVANWLGSQLFLEAYLDSAVIASLGSLVFPVLARHFTGIPSLGASGAIMSMFGIFSFLSPASKVFLFFIPVPLNTLMVFFGTMAISAGGLLARRTMLDHAGHLGGCVAGTAWGYYLQEKVKRARARRRQAIEQGKWW